GWATLRTTAATSVVFILANSAAGLLGQLGTLDALPDTLWPWAGAALAGGSIGSWLGARRLPGPALRALLAAVLLLAGVKLVLT
ncbi:MAG: TSUP family transporter, partial [Gemmatimonadales bacterium]